MWVVFGWWENARKKEGKVWLSKGQISNLQLAHVFLPPSLLSTLPHFILRPKTQKTTLLMKWTKPNSSPFSLRFTVGLSKDFPQQTKPGPSSPRLSHILTWRTRKPRHFFPLHFILILYILAQSLSLSLSLSASSSLSSSSRKKGKNVTNISILSDFNLKFHSGFLLNTALISSHNNGFSRKYKKQYFRSWIWEFLLWVFVLVSF